MGQEIKLNRADFDAALASIQSAQSRSWENNGSFKTDTINSTDATSVVAYQDAVIKLKDYLQKYNTALQGNLDNLVLVADVIEATDESLGSNY